MIRRLAIAALIFCVLFSAVYVYNFLVGDPTVVGPDPDGPKEPGHTTTEIRGSGTNKTYYERRDRSGTLTGKYEFDSSRRLSQTSVSLVRPTITLYRPKGQRVYIYADTGMLYAAQVGTGFDPRRGVLKGRVRVFIDRSTDSTRPAGETPDGDLIRIYGQQVEFDSDTLTIRMGGEVAVLSQEADIFGRDLAVLWHEAPETELKKLTLAHGRCMVIYSDSSALDSSTPSKSAGSPTGSPTGPSTGPPAGPPRPKAVAPSRPKVPAVLGGRFAPETRNVYKATFNNNVEIFSGKRSMRHARALSLRFEWDRDTQGLPEGLPEGKAPKSSPRRLGGESPLQPVSRAPRRPAPPSQIAMTADGANAVEPEQTPTTAPTTQRISLPTTYPTTRKKMAGEPTVVMWTGPLVIEPVGRSEEPDTRRYLVEARGKRIVWETEEIAAICSTFSVSQRIENDKGIQEIVLGGVKDAPVRLALAGRDGVRRIKCSEIRFHPDGGLAQLMGPGRILSPGKDDDVDDPLLALDLDALPDPPDSDRVTWEGDLIANFVDVKVPGPDGKPKRRKDITNATFNRKIELVQADTGDYVRCDKSLQVWMSPSARGGRARPFPSKVRAIGNVQARQEGRDISADSMTIDFAERDLAATDPAASSDAGAKAKTTTFGGKEMSVRPVTLVAVGNVKINDTRGTEALVATAGKLETDIVNEKAILEGDLAEVIQGDSALRGRIIHLDQAGESVVVLGGGRLKFMTDTDLDGKKLADPRPLVATWDRQMTFSGKRDTASFLGAVKMTSGEDSLNCEEMDLDFEKTPAKAAPATAPAKVASTPRAGLGLDKRRLKTITCRKNVSMNRVVKDAKGLLSERMRLTGRQLTYDAGPASSESRGAKMVVSGPGTMSMEDYRPAVAKAPVGGGPVKAPGPAMPSQTVFVWKGGMAFMLKERQVVLHDDVTMVHRSGDQIVLAERLPGLGKLGSGRNVRLSCEKMAATFDKAAPADAADAAVAVGKLQDFLATGKVDLAEGKRRMLGEELNYDRAREIIIIKGSKNIPATLMYQPTAGSTLKRIRSDLIECFLKDDKIVRVRTAAVTGG